MKSVKPGRGPSMMGAVMAVIIALFGILWVCGAVRMEQEAAAMPGFAGGGVGRIFPLFGVIFVLAALASAVYHFRNATGKQRFSAFDITEDGEEDDPLNERFGGKRFCPHCGGAVGEDDRYCSSCGKALEPER